MNDYARPSHTSRSDAAKKLASTDPELIVDALIGAALEEPERAWIEAQCLALVGHGDARVRRAVVQSVGHVARIHRAVDPRLVTALEGLGKDQALSGAVSDALDDIHVFLKGR
jgi:hypothetical protein